MKQELVEKVARHLARTHFGVTGEWSMDKSLSVAFMEVARYALALAERAARWAECGHVGSAAVERAVEGGA